MNKVSRVTALMQNSTNVHQQLQNMLYAPILLSFTKKQNLFARRRLRGLVVFFFAHDTQIQVAHALCKQCCRLISYTANKRRVTLIEACYNFPRSPIHSSKKAGETIPRSSRSHEADIYANWKTQFTKRQLSINWRNI